MTVQANVVPATSLVKATEDVLPEHIVEFRGVAIAKGIGSTYIVTVIDAPPPGQPAV